MVKQFNYSICLYYHGRLTSDRDFSRAGGLGKMTEELASLRSHQSDGIKSFEMPALMVLKLFPTMALVRTR